MQASLRTVSVHVVTYNSGDHIEDCLEAILNQSHPIDQIIVIDNDSKDDTCEKLLKWQDRCTIIRNVRNNGFAGGHNQAIRLTSTEYCLILNPDVVLEPDYVSNTIQVMHSNDQLGSATGKLLFKAAPNHIDSAGLTINKARRAFDRGVNQTNNNFSRSEEVFGVSGAAAMYKRKMINDISINGEFFDEDFFAYKEDVDVAWRAQLLGWKAVYEPSALAYHERGWKEGGRGSKPLFVRRLSYINRYKMMVKNDDFLKMMKHILPLLVFECSSFLYVLVREPLLLGAWVDLYYKYPELKKKRNLIHDKRKVATSEVSKWLK